LNLEKVFIITTIGFIRHGVTAWNKLGREQGGLNIPLDEDGIRMSEKIADRLSGEGWQAIYTSPLQRAKVTAEIIAAKNPGVNFQVDKRLREIGSGLIEGTTEVERIERWGASWHTLNLNGEKSEQVIARGLHFIEDIKTKHAEENVLIVSHGSFISTLINKLSASKIVNIDNSSLTIIEMHDDSNICTLVNCTKHLN